MDGPEDRPTGRSIPSTLFGWGQSSCHTSVVSWGPLGLSCLLYTIVEELAFLLDIDLKGVDLLVDPDSYS